MVEKFYILQMRNWHYDGPRWISLDEERFATAEAAEAARNAKPFPKEYRVAEAYVQIRYKPVKMVGG